MRTRSGRPDAALALREGVRDTMPGAIEVVVGAMLCTLRVWTEAEWAELPGRERPRVHVHAEGLGWVGAVPRLGLN